MSTQETNRTILVVDDDPEFLYLTSEVLKKDGHKILTAKNIKEALRVIYEEGVSLVITDLYLTAESGLSLLQEVAKNRPDLKFIMITAHSDPQAYILAQEEGVFDYFHKPLNIEAFRGSVKRALVTEEGSA